ncbi:hypothetical protein [Corynebacterium frankenforstense]
MTGPNDPRDNGDADDRDGMTPGSGSGDGSGSGSGQGAASGSYPSYPAYPSTTHPEDREDFDKPGARYGAAGHGASGYGQGYGYDAAGYDQGYGYDAAGYGQGYGYGDEPVVRQGDGRVSITESIAWGFRAVFSGWQVWVLGTLAMLAVVVPLGGIGVAADINSGSETGSAVGLVTNSMVNFGMLFLMPLVYNLALGHVSRGRVDWSMLKENLNYLPTLGMSVLVSAVVGIVVAVILVPGLLLTVFSTAATTSTGDDLPLGALIGLGVVMLLVLLVGLLAGPLTALWTWTVADRRASFGAAIGVGFRAGLKNFFPLLGLNILLGLITFVLTLITFGLALLVVMPASYNAQAHAYRQAVGGVIPARR